MKEDTLNIRILDDGTIRVDSGPVSNANHVAAEGLMKLFATMSGGEVTRQRKGGSHVHTHNHTHTHADHTH